MKNFIYNLVKAYIKTGLYSYHKKIEVFGLENVPKDKPVLFLPNHQSALMDVLLIAVDCNRKPYFLTRADVFGKPFLNKVFHFFRMIPVYRIRDGRKALSKNDEVFDTCSRIFGQGSSLVMFPEANHNIRRRVRPLSKGFTRIVFRTLEQNPNADLQIVPVGLNYKDVTGFPDTVAIFYGQPIASKSLYDGEDILASEKRTKQAVSNALKQLTTHIPMENDYERVLNILEKKKVSFLRPQAVNKVVAKLDENLGEVDAVKKPSLNFSMVKAFIALINLPIWLLWHFVVKPKVWEPEFTGTLRFATALIGFTLYYPLLLIILTLFYNFKIGLLSVIGLYILNRILVKWG